MALDLDSLYQKWQKAQTAWFLPKMLNTGSVRSNLRTALPEKVKPDPAEMGDVVAAALRLREINNELASSHAAAESLLGRSWKQGEPEGDQLARIRAWGQTLHQRLKQVAGKDSGWLVTMQGLLSDLFRAGPPSYQPGTTDGDRLVAFRDTHRSFDDASEAFTASAALNRTALDDLPNHLSAVAAVLAAFLQSAPRLRAIHGEFATAAHTAQACLGVLWEKGEPTAEAIDKARSWVEAASCPHALLRRRRSRVARTVPPSPEQSLHRGSIGFAPPPSVRG